MTPAKRSEGRSHRYSLSELPLTITCPDCGLYMGRCRDEATRTTALRTHAQHCRPDTEGATS